MSKILEKVVLHKLLSHFQENNLSNPFQSAYRAGHSTETVLLRIVNDILSALDNDNISVLLLDLSAAFDTTDYQIFLSRLNSALQWFHSYLSDRYQFTSVNNSVFVTITAHVRCASGLSTGAHSLRPVHYASLRYYS